MQRRDNGKAPSKVVLVTGASAGIGLATAGALEAAGWDVVGASRRGTTARGCAGLVMDVDEGSSVTEGVAQVLERHGRLDALVTCAGWGLAGPAEQAPVPDAKAQLETNFWGTVRAVQAVLPTMRRQGRGRLVLISSIGGVIGLPFASFYSASKFALEGWGEAMAYEVAPFGVRVTMVEPGNARTDFTAKRRSLTSAPSGADDAYAQASAKAIAVMERDEQSGASPDAVASVIVKVLASKRPPRRVSVGKASERVGVLGKKVLPFRVFEAAAKSSLGV